MINFKISKTYFLISRKIIAYTVSFVVVVAVFQLLSDRTKRKSFKPKFTELFVSKKMIYKNEFH